MSMNRILLEQAPKDRETLIVLYHLPDNNLTPYATWLVHVDRPEQTFYGNYFETLEEAEDDFERRSFGGLGEDGRLEDIMMALGASPEEKAELRHRFGRYY